MIVYFIFLLMLSCHIIDDFVLQPICLSNLKQRQWWEKNAPDSLYKKDYICALMIHGLSWSILVHMPLMIYYIITGCGVSVIFFGIILFQALLHAYVDDLKANYKTISLSTDQKIHLLQIIVSLIIIFTWL